MSLAGYVVYKFKKDKKWKDKEDLGNWWKNSRHKISKVWYKAVKTNTEKRIQVWGKYRQEDKVIDLMMMAGGEVGKEKNEVKNNSTHQ